jgi:predicted nucleic acid-binding protein
LKLVVDASAALAWIILRADPDEAMLARRTSLQVQSAGADVPALWFSEVANTLLVFERAKKLTESDSATYLFGLSLLKIRQDDAPCTHVQPRVLDLGRRYNLTAYDSTYLELAMRNRATLATFDRRLGEAARSAGIEVFGDTP